MFFKEKTHQLPNPINPYQIGSFSCTFENCPDFFLQKLQNLVEKIHFQKVLLFLVHLLKISSSKLVLLPHLFLKIVLLKKTSLKLKNPNFVDMYETLLLQLHFEAKTLEIGINKFSSSKSSNFVRSCYWQVNVKTRTPKKDLPSIFTMKMIIVFVSYSRKTSNILLSLENLSPHTNWQESDMIMIVMNKKPHLSKCISGAFQWYNFWRKNDVVAIFGYVVCDRAFFQKRQLHLRHLLDMPDRQKSIDENHIKGKH